MGDHETGGNDPQDIMGSAEKENEEYAAEETGFDTAVDEGAGISGTVLVDDPGTVGKCVEDQLAAGFPDDEEIAETIAAARQEGEAAKTPEPALDGSGAYITEADMAEGGTAGKETTEVDMAEEGTAGEEATEEEIAAGDGEPAAGYGETRKKRILIGLVVVGTAIALFLVVWAYRSFILSPGDDYNYAGSATFLLIQNEEPNHLYLQTAGQGKESCLQDIIISSAVYLRRTDRVLAVTPAGICS